MGQQPTVSPPGSAASTPAPHQEMPPRVAHYGGSAQATQPPPSPNPNFPQNNGSMQVPPHLLPPNYPGGPSQNSGFWEPTAMHPGPPYTGPPPGSGMHSQVPQIHLGPPYQLGLD